MTWFNADIILAGGANYVMGNNDTLVLIQNTDGGAWIELTRSNN